MNVLSYIDSKNVKEITPILFVGLGGTGQAIGRDLKRRLKALFGGKIPEIIQFLFLDTIPLMNKYGEEPITPDEYVCLGNFNSAEVAKNAERDYPEIAVWLPDKDPGITSAIHGAGQRRYIGRMGLFLHFLAVFESFSRKLAELKSISAIEALRLEGYQVNDAIPRVFVFSSLAGGTGSGIFLDVAYLIRALAPEVFLNGVLLLSDVFANDIQDFRLRQRTEANCYTALLELDYCVHFRKFECDYGPRLVDIQAPPFTTTYLVSRRSQEGKCLNNKDDAYRMLSYWFTTQMGGLGSQHLERISNVEAQDLPPYQGHLRAYSGLVAAALLFPAENISNYGGLCLGQVMIEQGYLAQSQRALDKVVLIPSLMPDKLRRALLDQEKLAFDAPTRSIERAKDIVTLSRLLKHQAEDQAAVLQSRQQVIQERVPKLEIMIREAIQAAVWEILSLDGIEAALVWTAGTFQRVTEAIRSLEMEQEKAEARRQELEDNIQDIRRDIEKLRRYSWLPWRRAKLRRMGLRASELLVERDEIGLNLFILRTLMDVYRRLQDGTDQYGAAVRNLRQLEGTLQVRRKELVECAHQFTGVAKELLAGRVTDPEIFDLVTPVVDSEYVQHFYQAHSRRLTQDITASFKEFNTSFTGLPDFLKTSPQTLQQRLLAFTRRPFEELVAKVRLLDLLKDDPALQGDLRLKALLARADVFLPFKSDQGFKGELDLAYIGHVGLDRWDPDETAQYIKPLLEEHHKAFNVAYTGDPHRIQVARTAHGYPLPLLVDLEAWQRSYKEVSASGAKPLHIDKRWPPSRQNGRWPWAVETQPTNSLNKVKVR